MTFFQNKFKGEIYVLADTGDKHLFAFPVIFLRDSVKGSDGLG